MNSFNMATGAAIALLVAGCSGGGGAPVSNGGGGGPTVLTGHFADSPVEGLAYSTATQSGVTDATGAFQYLAGETITFSVGDTVVGSPVTGASVITPRDLVPGAPLYTTAAELEKAWRRPKSAETLAFLRFTSILVFLQSLDEDADPANGITINDSIPALFYGIQFDFDATVKATQPVPYPFSRAYGSKLGRILYQATTMGFASNATTRKITRAMDHFYNEQGVNTNVAHLTMKSVDSDADSDPGVNETVAYTYDSDGRLASEGHDFDGDGVADTLRTYIYDAAGNQTRISSDYAVDGVEDEAWISDYDPEGRLIAEIYELLDSGGGIPFSQTSVYSYDDAGYRVSETVGGGFGDESYTFEYDAEGNLVGSLFDNGADLVSGEYTYDSDGNLLSNMTDYGDNDVVDEIFTFEYDSAGNLTRTTLDYNGDGSGDYITTAIYNSDGNPVSEVEDNDGDGMTDAIVTYDYDAEGNLTSRSRDTDGDGSAESIVTFTYDASGARTGESHDSDGDGVPDYSMTYSYDSNGNVISENMDSDGDGVADMIATYTYENGNWSSIQQNLPWLLGL